MSSPLILDIKPTARLQILPKNASYQIGGLRILRRIIFSRHILLVVSQLWKTQLVLFRPGHLQRRTVFKSAGEDSIPALLKTGIEMLSGPLVKILTACLALGYIAEARQGVRVILIPMSWRTSYEVAKSWKNWLISQLEWVLKKDFNWNAHSMHNRGVDQVRPRFTIWSVESSRCWATKSLQLVYFWM
jgi:hypothetical protein